MFIKIDNIFDFMKFELWNKEDLKGVWTISIKIDGVRCHNINGQHFSRKNKPLYNIPKFNGEIAEIFCGSFKKTIEATRTFTKEMEILPEHIYELHPNLDKRLILGDFNNPTKEFITETFEKYHSLGYEGLILQQGNKRLKVKNEETHDVKITGILEGKGRNKGRLGKFVTEMGKVGTGLTDLERIEYWNPNIIGETIEVKCMEITPYGKFRQPRFIRMRYDK